MDEMTPYEILTKAQDLIHDPKNWTQGALARNENSNSLLSHEDEAVCFCALGAIIKVGDVSSGVVRRNANQFLSMVMGDIPDFNDTHTHAEVMSAFDRAREMALQEKQA